MPETGDTQSIPGGRAPVPAAVGLSEGGGEMGALMRAFDWGATPLGPAERWSESLRTVVRILLTSRFAMWMGWGPELTFLYNDAYGRMTLGAKHPWALGRPAREVWAEIWGDIGPRIRTVLETGAATWDEGLLLFLERSGYPEETYHTFSYSPLADDAGRTTGMLCVVSEETERVIGERRLRVLREAAARMAATRTPADVFGAVEAYLDGGTHDLPFTLTYLLDPDAGAARVVARTGIPSGHPAAPEVVRLDGGDAAWPVREVVEGLAPVRVDGLAPAFGVLPGGPWDLPASGALVVPVAQQGQTRPAGVFVAGLNPYRPLDDEYRGFIEVFVGQVAAALASANAYEEERKRVEALAELDRAKTAFFSNVSHEFRTPLTLMLGPVEDALADAAEPLPPRQRERQEIVHRNALRLLKLVNSLLDFSRIEAGRVQASYAPTDLAALTAELASMFRSATERAGLRLAVDAPPLPEPVYVDRDMWEKVVLNLLSNAFKHTFQGGIGVSLRPAGDRVELEVSDTGIGIPEGELPHLFTRFHRVEGARGRTHEGSGIGLALVQELVKLHGGEVRVRSAVGRGSAFTVSLPAGAAHLPAERIGAPPEAPGVLRGASFVEEALRWLPDTPGGALPAGEGRTLRADLAAAAAEARVESGDGDAYILLADDNADMRDYAARLLRERYRVEAVSNGAAALAAALARVPDLVVSDVMMPELDGFGLLRQLRADERTRDVPVLLLSARAGEESRIEGLQAGADDYLVKPFSARELMARVGAHLELARARREAQARLTRIFMQAPVAISVVTGPDLVFEFANPRYLEMVGRDDLVGRTLREVFPELPHDEPVFRVLEGVYENGVGFASDEYRMELRRGGVVEEVFLQFSCEPLRDASGAVRSVVTVAVDITAQVRSRQQVEQQAFELQELQAETEAINAELQEANEELSTKTREAEEANRAKGEFLASMSHELRTPLNAIAGYVDLLALEIHGPVTDAQGVALQRIKRNQQVLLSLITDVLNFAKLEAGKLEIESVAVPVGEVLEGLEPLIAPQLGAKALAYHCAPYDGGLVASGDAERIQQVLINLLTNAVKFTGEGGRVDVAAEERDGIVRVRVSDTGRGIPPDKLETIFDPFVQVDRRGALTDSSQQGVGLGLAISRELARAMGGDLTAESAPGEGATFVLALPAAPRQASA